MDKTKFALKILVAVFAVLVISSTATADEKPEIFAQLGAFICRYFCGNIFGRGGYALS